MKDYDHAEPLAALPREVRALVLAVDRARDRWGDADEDVRAELWRGMHDASDAVWAMDAGKRLVITAGDIRRLGEAVASGDPDEADGVPFAVLVEEPTGLVWRVVAVEKPSGLVWRGNPPVAYDETETWMVAGHDGPSWRTDRVTDDGIAGHGPWRVVWSRGVAW